MPRVSISPAAQRVSVNVLGGVPCGGTTARRSVDRLPRAGVRPFRLPERSPSPVCHNKHENLELDKCRLIEGYESRVWLHLRWRTIAPECEQNALASGQSLSTGVRRAADECLPTLARRASFEVAHFSREACCRRFATWNSTTSKIASEWIPCNRFTRLRFGLVRITDLRD
jgi:hypothetical protein